MGYGRHDWGDIHFWASMVFIAAIALHVILHWDWLVATFKRYLNIKTATGVALAHLIPLLIVLSPLIGERGTESEEDSGHGKERGSLESSFRVRGRTTLNEIEQATGVSAQQILVTLELPDDVPRNERLGELQDTFGFDIEGVRDALATLTDGEPIKSQKEDSCEESPSGAKSSFHVRGRTTLNEIERATGISVQQIRAAAGLPRDFPSDRRLGPLQEEYDFDIEQIREAMDRLAAKESPGI